MKLSILQETLSAGLGIVGRAVASRSTLPVLSNVLLDARDGKLKLSATNLEIGVNCWVNAYVTYEGAVTIPARLLTELVNSLPSERVDLTLDEDTQTLNLRCGKFVTNIKGIDAGEFPIVTAFYGGAIELPANALKAMIEQVTFAAATDDSRPILTGVLVQIQYGELTMAAADGFRLSVKHSNGLSDELATEAIIPAQALVELARLLKDQIEPVKVSISPERKRVSFILTDVELISQLIEGRFPDYTQIIPKSYTTRAVMDKGELLKSVKVAHLFARDSANIVKLEIVPGSVPENKSGLVILYATSAEMGDSVADVPANIEGNGMEIAFNAKYMLDALGAIDTPLVALETTKYSNPGVIRPVGDDKLTTVIIPMSLSK